MNGCRRNNVLLTTDDICGDNIQAAVMMLFDKHIGAVFIAMLILIGLCAWVANRPHNRPLRDDNINYQLSRINDRMDGPRR